MEERGCHDLLRQLRWPDGVTCISCRKGRLTIHTRSERTPRLRYLCLDCGRTFNDLTGTIFARSNLPLSTWFEALSLLRLGLSTPELARALAVKWDTARRVSRCLLVATGAPGLTRDLERALTDRGSVAKARATG